MAGFVMRNFEAGFFFAHGRWIPDPPLAEKFEHQADVQTLVNKYKWQNVELGLLHESGTRLAGGVRILPEGLILGPSTESRHPILGTRLVQAWRSGSNCEKL